MIKKIYWYIEALLFELYASASTVRRPKKPNNLDAPLIVSLTSHKLRFEKLELTLKSLLSQTIQPDKVILWLADHDYQLLPKNIKNLAKIYIFFDINICEDIRSYKKLIPSLKRYPESYIVTADDDIFYPRNWLEELIADRESVQHIIAHRVHGVKIEQGKIAPYEQWEMSVGSKPNTILFPTTGAGVLFPPNCFHQEVTNHEKFLSLCPTADDIWFFWMARLKGTEIKHSGFNLNLVSWRGTDSGGLAEQNVARQKNDHYIRLLTKNYYLDLETMNKSPNKR